MIFCFSCGNTPVLTITNEAGFLPYEGTEGSWWMWSSEKNATVEFESSDDAKVELKGTILAGPKQNKITISINDQTILDTNIKSFETEIKPTTFEVMKGKNIIKFEAAKDGTMTGTKKKRKLSFAIKNMQISSTNGKKIISLSSKEL